MGGSDKTATFAFEVKDETAGSLSAAANLEKLRSAVLGGNDSLRAMVQAMRNLKLATTPNTSAIKELGDRIAAQKASIAGAQESYLKLGGTFEKIGKQVSVGGEKAGGGLDELIGAARVAGGPMAGMMEKAKSLSSLLGGGVAVAAVATAAAVLALVVGVVAGVAALARFAIAVTDATRNQQLMFQGMTGSAAGASELTTVVDRVAKSVAISRDQVSGYAQDLYKAGLRGQTLMDALAGVSQNAAVLGTDAASQFAEVAKGAAYSGVAIKNIVNPSTMTAWKGMTQLSGLAGKQMLGFGAQVEKAKENLAALFKGVAIDPFLKGLQMVLELFDENTASGAALKTIVATILNPLFGAADTLAPQFKELFLDMEIGALKVIIMVLKFRNSVRDSAISADSALTGLKVGGLALLTAGFIALAPAAWAALAPIIAATAPFIAAAFALGLLAAAISELRKQWDGWGEALRPVKEAWNNVRQAFIDAWDYIANLDFGKLAGDLIDGLVNGIKNGAKFVLDAITNLGSSMIGGLKGLLHISSPSLVFAGLGKMTALGMAEGIESGTGRVDAAVSDMVKIPAPESAPTGGATTNNTRGGNTYHNVINVTAKAETMKGLARELANLLEGVTIQNGMPLEPEPA